MDIEQLETEIHITSEEQNSILIHIPSERDMLSSDMKEEHLDQMHTIHLLSTSQDEQHIQDDEMMEKLEITKLSKVVPKKRVSLTIEKKIEIIQRHEKGETQRALSQEYNVGRTTISDILKRKYKFFKFMTLNADKEENLKRRRTLRRTVHKELEDKLFEWYNECRAKGDYVSGPMISLKAQTLHKELGYTDSFTASNGWLDRFKVRNGIKLCGLREVKTESDVSAVAPFKTELESLATWYNLTLDQVYNADETDLFWKMLPNPESDVNEVKASVRAYRERMTVLACANASGTHKLPVVCIGRGKKSRTFTSHEVKTMPVNYFSQETAWMDQDIFREWFHSYFVPTVRQHLRFHGLPEAALLLIDKSFSHPADQHLRSEDGFFFCQMFPAKVKSLIQPMELGITSNMKRYYRRELLTDLISKANTIPEFQKNLSLKDAIRGIATGWDSVTEETIRHCFSKIFPSAIDSMKRDFDGSDESISNDAFERLLQQIPECADYSSERLEKWLSCDDAEPQKDLNPGAYWILETSKMEESQDQIDHGETQDDENIVFIQHDQDDNPQTIEIIGASALTSSIIQEDSDEELLEDEHEELLAQQDALNSSHQMDSNVIYEEDGDVSCKQALDALNVVLKFMKNDSDSRYKDVVMLQELKKKLRQKVNMQGVKTEIRDLMF